MNAPRILNVFAVLILSLTFSRAWATELGAKGTRFTINGQPTFLYGISYYAGLGASEEFARQDLDDMQRYGFNWIRVWATWAAFQNDLSAVDPATGQPRQPYFDRLLWLVRETDRRGMIVDITLARGDGIPPGRLDSQEKHLRVVTTLVTALKAYHNWYIDLSNERDVRDKRFTSFTDLRQLRDEVRRIDPTRLVTASSGSDIAQDDLPGYLKTVQVDFITPHRPRDAKSPTRTERYTRDLLAAMEKLGRVVPIHYQEPFRRGYTDWQPKADDFVTDATAAKAGGAAGWCFHNGSQRHAPDGKPRRSFDLREKRLFDQLDEEERKAIQQLRPLFSLSHTSSSTLSPTLSIPQ